MLRVEELIQVIQYEQAITNPPVRSSEGGAERKIVQYERKEDPVTGEYLYFPVKSE